MKKRPNQHQKLIYFNLPGYCLHTCWKVTTEDGKVNYFDLNALEMLGKWLMRFFAGDFVFGDSLSLSEAFKASDPYTYYDTKNCDNSGYPKRPPLVNLFSVLALCFLTLLCLTLFLSFALFF